MAVAEFKTAQCRIKPGRIIAEGAGAKRGSQSTIVWMTPTRARLMIDAGAVELVNMVPLQPVIGPTEHKPTGPSETKPMEPAEKKSFAAAPAGLSTDFPLSSELGTAAQSSALVEAHRLPQNSAPRSKRRGRQGKSE